MNQPQLIEGTAKRWKALQLVGGLLWALGTVAAITAALRDGHASPLAQDALVQGSCAVATCGMVITLYGRIGAWWHHG